MKRISRQKILKIKLLILDVDGVLTDGRIVLDDEGREIKFFDVQDGFGLVLFRKAGYKTAIISARSAHAVTARARDIAIDKVCQDACPKIDAYESLLKEWNLTDDEVCFMGDDLPDIGILKRAGLGVAVPNAVAEVQKAADHVTQNRGGHGAVREIVELILKTQGQWKKIVSNFS